MRALTAILMLLTALPAWADNRNSHSPAWGAARELAATSQRLERSALRLYRDLHAQRGRSEAASRARSLALATQEFRQQVARNVPPRRLQESFRHVERRQQALEQQLARNAWFRPRSQVGASLRDLSQATSQVERALSRQLYAQRNDRDYRDRDYRDRDYDRDPYPPTRPGYRR
jgi:hypothetical protein